MSVAPPPADDRDAPPPFGGRWRNLYALVIAALVVVIALLLWLTRSFD